MLNILIVDQDAAVVRSLHDALTGAGHGATGVTNWAEGLTHLRRGVGGGPQPRALDLVVCDVLTSGLVGQAVVSTLKQVAPQLEVILMSARASVREAITAIRAQAADYLQKPVHLPLLLDRVATLGRERRARQQAQAEAGGGPEGRNSAVPDALEARTAIAGQSMEMTALRARIAAIAESDTPVLITGESGTGKELVARAIHRESAREAGALVTVNAAALPAGLIEAELFGHERGAFTGADRRRDGRFLAAHGGTLFLDEIGDLPLEAQVKLLRVLQEGTFQPLGSNRTVRVDVRVLSATNRDLRGMVKDGKFREDLLYRLRVFEIHVPPLRQRTSDLPALVDRFLARLARPGEVVPAVSQGAWEALMRYPFPGNVRELENTVNHALVLARGRPEILPKHLPAEIQDYARAEVTPGPSLSRAVEQFEREYILRALAVTGGEKKKAAQILGISRQSLYQKLSDSPEPGSGGSGAPRTV